MIRILILIGFTFIFMHLHATGDISKYINMKYSWISFGTIFVLWFLTIAELIFYMIGPKKHDDDCSCGCVHNQQDGKWKRRVWYPIYILPVLTVLFLPVATLDSNIVEAKGFHFPIYDKKDPYSSHQFLQPDTSSFYGEEAYDKMIHRDLKKFSKGENINLEDEEFLNAMETIYRYPGEFTDKTISFKGFMYQTKELKKNQYFLFRFGIIHCIADSGVFGMLIEFPDDVTFKNDDWATVTGKISTMYYQPFKKTIPVVKVTKVKREQSPKDPYVYRNNQ
ncbi:TIGR03943 family protein [Priestia megaterium]|uniref:TIGR03943 family putative permease subunit n=1 Tax=Priestia megaterium TaxID=1404 RepID=UPI0020768126|nr:TIGR03943 family protein [Priestia megaterium]USD17814.1 TIGR03943 family protein [Priestia megaterium]USD18905.1 TIGR03943 family protein [Priestia megaterium]